MRAGNPPDRGATTGTVTASDPAGNAFGEGNSHRALLGWTRGRTNRNGMRTTLERIKAEVESR